MRLFRTRRLAIAAIALLLAGLGVGHAFAARGGLSITPGILEHVARPGGIGAVQISNSTSRPMKIGLAVRPWVQARSGAVAPNRQATLGKVRPYRGSFGLAAGATRTVQMSLARRPAGGALYGAIEVTGTPKRQGGKGVRVAYRLVTSLRLTPPAGAQAFRVSAGSLLLHGSTSNGTLLLAVRNDGNTILPIGGSVRISGRGHVLRNEVTPDVIVPGATVNLRLTRLRGTLPRGRYNISVNLTQGGHSLGVVKRRGVRLR